SRDIEALRHLMQKYPFYVVSDEVYEHLVFDEHKHDSILKYPDLFSRSLVVFSFGKVFHATGWKLGYVVAPADIMTEFRKLHQYLSFSCNTPMQVALSQYLQTESHYLELSSFYQVKRDYFLEQIRDLPFTMHQPAAGSYFQLLGYDRMRTLPDREFAEWLTREVGVAVIPVSAFYQEGTDHHVVRFCFAKKKETIDAAIEKLHQWQK
ncbi:MAG TPA: aminotransferase class I/II-fold pyridoxal phosphate-dependent enzyme, partial [Chitinophagaceae bacterium]|nr:aminotransferase class I/II-fold pyridoxal phosphate-dependent enzyme [Chitinophagaceae bacterium]